MSIVFENTLWLKPLILDSNLTMLDTTLGYQIPSSLNFSTSISFSKNSNQFSILKWSVRIFGAVLIIIGGIGNTLSAFTLSRKKLRAQVTSVYLIALALSDLGKSVSNFVF